MFLRVTISFLLILSFACQDGTVHLRNQYEEKTFKAPIRPADQKVTDLVLDSMQIEAFIKKDDIDQTTANRIRKFYSNRAFQYAWITEEGLSEHAQVFWNMHNEFVNYSNDSSVFDKELHESVTELLEEEIPVNRVGMPHIEIALTAHFFDYSKYAFTGTMNPDELQWHIPRKKINPVNLLNSLLKTENDDRESWAPQSMQYKALRDQLRNYESLQEKLGKLSFNLGDKKVLRRGDSAAIVPDIKFYLQEVGDLISNDHTPVFDEETEVAVMRFQNRHGLEPDGVLGQNTLRELSVPISKRIEQMLINMERMRWLPEKPAGTSIVVNIPEFRVHVYEGQQRAFSMNIVVGKAGNRTVIFQEDLEYIVFSPYWNIPRSIVRNEIQPALQRNSNYLSQNNMEITGYSNGLPVIRQKPGEGNALGKVKFIFPNRFNIYLHDTPAKTLFERTKRAFSHGCIRVEEPFKLAKYLLRKDEAWTDERIQEHMNLGTEKWVKLDEKIPVSIVYITSWVNKNGEIQFRQDIYGHDKRMSKLMFTE